MVAWLGASCSHKAMPAAHRKRWHPRLRDCLLSCPRRKLLANHQVFESAWNTENTPSEPLFRQQTDALMCSGGNAHLECKLQLSNIKSNWINCVFVCIALLLIPGPCLKPCTAASIRCTKALLLPFPSSWATPWPCPCRNRIRPELSWHREFPLLTQHHPEALLQIHIQWFTDMNSGSILREPINWLLGTVGAWATTQFFHLGSWHLDNQIGFGSNRHLESLGTQDETGMRHLIIWMHLIQMDLSYDDHRWSVYLWTHGRSKDRYTLATCSCLGCGLPPSSSLLSFPLFPHVQHFPRWNIDSIVKTGL